MSFTHIALKSSTIGAVGALASRFIIGKGTFQLWGMSAPIWLAVGLAVSTAGVLGEIVAHYAFPLLGDNKWVMPMAGATITVLDGLATLATIYLENPKALGPGGIGALTAFAIGSGSYIAGDYLYRNFIGPFWGMDSNTLSY